MDNIQIKNEDVGRLIIDLLIKSIAETQALRELVILQVGAAAPPQNRDKVVQDIGKGFPNRYNQLREALKEDIYKQYGHIDLEGIVDIFIFLFLRPRTKATNFYLT